MLDNDNEMNAMLQLEFSTSRTAVGIKYGAMSKKRLLKYSTDDALMKVL